MKEEKNQKNNNDRYECRMFLNKEKKNNNQVAPAAAHTSQKKEAEATKKMMRKRRNYAIYDIVQLFACTATTTKLLHIRYDKILKYRQEKAQSGREKKTPKYRNE